MNDVRYQIITRIICVLLLGSVFNQPYWFYDILRVIISVGLIVYLILNREVLINLHKYILGGIVVLFNPLLPTYLSKSTWRVLDIVILLYLLFLGENKFDFKKES